MSFFLHPLLPCLLLAHLLLLDHSRLPPSYSAVVRIGPLSGCSHFVNRALLFPALL